MLILTDRAKDGLAIHDRLAKRGRCEVVDVRQGIAHASKHPIILCDIDLANPTSVRLASAALTRREGGSFAPVLVLMRNSRAATGVLPASLHATEAIHSGAPPELIFAVAQRLIDERKAKGKAPPAPASAKESAVEAKSSLAMCLDSGRRREPVSVAELEKGASIVLGAIKQHKIRSWLDVVRRYDDVTYQHCLLVAGLVAALSVKLGLMSRHQNRLTQAAIIHDVGKARVSPNILNKPGELTTSEKEIMHTHAALGYDMLARQGDISPVILDVVRHHHEYLDGTGYPDGLRGSQISTSARIVTICDIYAALIERRPYKAPMPPRQALAILTAMGAKLDRDLLKSFEAVIAETE